MKRKKSGSYYTPQSLASFMLEHLMSTWGKEEDPINVLEPSCGDGVFLKALIAQVNKKPNLACKVDAVELNPDAIKQAKVNCTGSKRISIKYHNKDFLFFLERRRKKYDLIIGNPPYIAKKYLEEEQKKQCSVIHEKASLTPKSFPNIWSAFLINSILTLSERGVLAFVLPTELLQVKFSAEIRRLLIDQFDLVEVFTFKELLFENIGQDTVLLFAYKQSEKKGIYFSEINKPSDLADRTFSLKKNNFIKKRYVKWTNNILSQSELKLLYGIREEIDPISSYCNAVAGIVTAANSFFIVTNDVMQQYGFESISRPIVQKGMFVNGSVVFSDHNMDFLNSTNKPCHLLCFENKPMDEFSKSFKEYLDLGIVEEINTRYKCLERPRWYVVPLQKSSDGIFFKRSHHFPKLLVNEANALVTDSGYKITMKPTYDIKSLTYSFYNSLTLCFSELDGRYYGGGVLELTPLEFKQLPLPYNSIGFSDFNDFKDDFEKKSSIDQIIHSVDGKILKDKLGLSDKSISILNRIRHKLVSRRCKK